MEGNKMLTLSQKMNQAYSKLCRPILEEFDLARPSFDILMLLGNHPQYYTAQQISSIWGIKKNLISVHVEKLVEGSYLERGTVEGDRRKIELICTQKAQPVLERGRQLQAEFFRRLTKGLPEEELERCGRLMETLAANADEV